MRRIAKNRVVWFCAVLTAFGVAPTGLVQAAEFGTLYGVKQAGHQLIVRSLELGGSLLMRDRGKLPHQAEERLNAIFQNKDRSIGVLRTSTKAESTRRALVRIAGVPELITDVSGWDVSGLDPSEAISSVLVPLSGPPIALIAHYSDTAPFSLATINLQQGQGAALKLFALDPHARYGHLTQCPDGAIYAISLAQQWAARIIEVNLATKTVTHLAELQVNGKSLHGDVLDLVCGTSGDLYALANPDFSEINSLFKVSVTTGVMTWMDRFDVDRMTFVH